ncbi:GerMN domain-containing protein [Vallitalea sp.]|jgi:spore germination protein GerM|uniref:GerMN domain-containing protein n=1 Tax=Vallitalea sp. TaxID=1882829 RepID=UPI0025F74F5A|nr:GerMN domain-containing protein [Vallitalea sp.]MCT4685863.1 GerMN domain-containing protein [Vallitalea sp.]
MYSVINAFVVSLITMGLVINTVSMKSNIFYYEFEQQDEGILTSQEIDLKDNKNVEENIRYTLQYLFDNNEGYYSFIPEKVTITNILFINGSLEIEVSEDMLNYGGTAREISMVDQILATVFANNEIEEFSLFIEGDREVLNEGTTIKEYTRDEWEERMKTIE